MTFHVLDIPMADLKSANAVSHQSSAMSNIVAFGDSITRGYGVPDGEGWVELLAKAMNSDDKDRSSSVFNAGGNSNTSSEGLRRIESDILVRMPGLVLIEFGGNDAVHSSRTVSVDQFKGNLLSMIGTIRRYGGLVVLMTFPPIINSWHAWNTQPYYERWGGVDQCVERYRQCARNLAASQKIPLFDLDHFLRRQIAEQGQAALIKPDGVHLTTEAHRLIAGAVRDFLDDSAAILYHKLKLQQSGATRELTGRVFAET